MFRLIKLAIWILILGWVFLYFGYKNFTSELLQQEKKITVEDGDGIRTTLQREFWLWKLQKYYLKKFIANEYPDTPNVYPWEYTFSQGMSWNEIIDRLQKPAQKDQIFVQILEWWNIFDIDACLSNPESFHFFDKKKIEHGCLFEKDVDGSKIYIQRPIIEEKTFSTLALQVGEYAKKYPFLTEAESLEGFLYPNTYSLEKNSPTPTMLIDEALQAFNDTVYTPLLKGKSSKEIVELLKFASIVEREAFSQGGLEERSTIAGILMKRYHEKWMIGADITACYAYKLTSTQCQMTLSEYIYDKNEYNTRTMVWLPKTPINNPQLTSIKAVLNPKETSYYFYLHDSSGLIHYATTNAQHESNKQLY